MRWPRLFFRLSTMQTTLYNTDHAGQYKFEIINARFIASGVAIQAKGLAYRLRPNKGRDAQKNEDYKLGTLPGYATGGGTTEGGRGYQQGRGEVERERRLLAGRTALTDMVVKVPGRVCF